MKLVGHRGRLWYRNVGAVGTEIIELGGVLR